MESSSLLRWSRIIIEMGGRDSYSPASQSFARLVLISFARRLMTIQYEICGLTIAHGLTDCICSSSNIRTDGADITPHTANSVTTCHPCKNDNNHG
ncbi:MAG: hypothetical protein K9M81_05080 [Chthoniobacterales bacterium]|nr:hypothetical protein [Chthoniobacterales bacterium]